MIKFLLWCILFVLCWPLALGALLLYPVVWLLLLPFRIVGIAVGGALELIFAIILLPVRLIRAIQTNPCEFPASTISCPLIPRRSSAIRELRSS